MKCDHGYEDKKICSECNAWRCEKCGYKFAHEHGSTFVCGCDIEKYDPSKSKVSWVD